MKIPKLLAGLSLASSLFLAPILSTAHAKSFVGKSTSAPPSVPGGAPITVAVYNYLKNPATAYFVNNSSTLQLVPGAPPVPPMTGSTPTPVQSYVGATLVFRGPRGAGSWKHFGGVNPTPFIVLGNPPPGAALPPGYKGKTAAGTGGSGPGGTPPATPGTPPKIVNKSVVNKSVVNNPPASTPAAPAKGRKRGAKAPDVNIVVNPPAPSDTSSTTPTDPPAPTPAGAPVAAAKDDPEGDLQLNAEDPRVIEFLRIHNAARADVGVSPLEWSEDLAGAAQELAEHLAHTGRLDHEPDSEYGENLGSGSGNYTPASAANAWLAEKASFSPDNVEYRVTTTSKGKGGKTVKHEEGAKTAHYSQMVWGEEHDGRRGYRHDQERQGRGGGELQSARQHQRGKGVRTVKRRRFEVLI